MKCSLGYLLALFLLVQPAVACFTDIDAIQQYDPVTGYPISPHYGEYVKIQGKVFVENYTFDRRSVYVQDATGGILVEMPDYDLLRNGDVIHVFGTVSLNARREIVLKDAAPPPYYLFDQPLLEPLSVPIGDLVGPDRTEFVGGYIACLGTVAETGEADFLLAGDDGGSLRVMIGDGTGIDIGNVDPGDRFLVTGPCTIHLGEVRLMPRTQADLLENPEGDPVPIIVDTEVYYYTHTENDPVTIGADILDDGIVAATLYYRDALGGVPSTDPFQAVPMTQVAGSTFEAVIPAPHTLDQIDYYVEADDGVNEPETYPGDAPEVFLSMAVNYMEIFDVQYVDPTADDQSSPYSGFDVKISGVVTFSTYEDYSTEYPFFVIQQFDAETGTEYDGGWKGLYVELGASSAVDVMEGDYVQVAGVVLERHERTVIQPYDDDAVTNSSSGNPLPEPIPVSLAVLNDVSSLDGDGVAPGEAYESVYVQTQPAYVNPLALEELQFYVQDGEVDEVDVNTQLLVKSRSAEFYEPAANDHAIIQGYLECVGAITHVVLARASDFHEWSPVPDDQMPPVPARTFSIVPNPCNPRTVVKFEVEKEAKVRLELYDVRGRLVRVLHDGFLFPREYSIPWDGEDVVGRAVASGVYYARLTAGDEPARVKAVTLLR